MDNGADKAVDGNPRTSWQEGVDGDGIGESVHLKLSKPYMVKYMSFRLGNWNSREYYEGNNRPKELEITAGDVTQTVEWLPGWLEIQAPFPALHKLGMVICAHNLSTFGGKARNITWEFWQPHSRFNKTLSQRNK